MTAATPSTAETFESGIRKTVRWYLDNTDWVANVQSGAYLNWVSTNYSNRKDGEGSVDGHPTSGPRAMNAGV
jgi:hypothetical protein